MGTTTEAYLIDMVIKGTLTNFPITPVGIANNRHMFGLDLPGVKRNTVQRKLDRLEVEDIVSITSEYN